MKGKHKKSSKESKRFKELRGCGLKGMSTDEHGWKKHLDFDSRGERR